MIVSIFVISVVAVALLISAGVVLIKDPKTGLPDKAMSIMAAIAAAGVGYLSGRASK